MHVSVSLADILPWGAVCNDTVGMQTNDRNVGMMRTSADPRRNFHGGKHAGRHADCGNMRDCQSVPSQWSYRVDALCSLI